MSRVDIPHSSLRPLLAITAIAFALRVAAWLTTSPSHPINDEVEYYMRAATWASGSEALGIKRAPLSVAGPGTLLWILGGGSVFAARFLNVVVGTLLVPLSYSLGAAVGRIGILPESASLSGTPGEPERAARLGFYTAIFTAFYPTLIGFSHYLWAEPTFVLFLVAGLRLIIADQEHSSWLCALLAGGVLGLATLSREAGLVVAPVLAVHLLWEQRLQRGRDLRRARAALLLCLGALLVVLPWSIHASALLGEPVLITSTSGQNLYLGNAPVLGEKRRPLSSFEGDLQQRERQARSVAVEAIWSRMPWWPLWKMKEVPNFFAPTSVTVKRLLAPERAQDDKKELGRWRYRFRWSWLDSEPLRYLAALLTALSYVGVVVAGSAGIALMRPSPGRRLLVSYVAAILIPVLVTFAITRFRLGAMPVFLLGSAYLALYGRAAWRGAPTRRRVLSISVAVTMVAILLLRARAFLSPTLT